MTARIFVQHLKGRSRDQPVMEQSCQEWNSRILFACPFPCGQSKGRWCEVACNCSASG